jgi:hypothetical protein
VVSQGERFSLRGWIARSKGNPGVVAFIAPITATRKISFHSRWKPLTQVDTLRGRIREQHADELTQGAIMPIIVCPCGHAITVRQAAVAKQVNCPACGRIHLIQTTAISSEARAELIIAAVMGAVIGVLIGVALLLFLLLMVFISSALEDYSVVEEQASFGALFWVVLLVSAAAGALINLLRKRSNL